MSVETAQSAIPETKGRLLDAAMRLMQAQGFTATSVDEICEAAGLTKGSFFHYFESKEDLAKAAVERYFQRQREMFANAPYRQKADPLERVLARFDFFSAMAGSPNAPKGCLLGTFAQELSATHPEIRALCQGMFETGQKEFARDLAEAKKAHPPVVKFDPESVARLWLSIVQGSMILAKTSQSMEPFVENLRHLRRYIEHLFGVDHD
ncbi:MAG TPA: TetR/AcrR family transcriptional regulator [Opitutales bacterium]|nr:TetR/AcrR family transcriptional regulator [Opitutales bacterium]